MKPREHFGGRAAVIMALAGSAIGLGNIWRFPYMVGENGGAAFILVYILATLLLLLPMFLAESVIGRRSRANAFGAMKALAPHSRWKWTGLFVVITPMIVLSYYSVVGGWALGYFGMSLTGGFLQSDPEALHGVFASFLDSSWKPVVCFTAFLAISCLIVAGGVKSGIEKFSKYSIPVLFLMIVTMAVFSLSLPGAAEGVRYLIRPDFSKLTASAVAAAVGQGFFSLSLGMGIVITYSSYVKPTENLVASGLGTAVADLLFALLAGFAVMPAVFAAGIEPAAGPGLVFETLPYSGGLPVFCRPAHCRPYVQHLADRGLCGLSGRRKGPEARLGLPAYLPGYLAAGVVLCLRTGRPGFPRLFLVQCADDPGRPALRGFRGLDHAPAGCSRRTYEWRNREPADLPAVVFPDALPGPAGRVIHLPF